jgi:hypothetical protein
MHTKQTTVKAAKDRRKPMPVPEAHDLWEPKIRRLRYGYDITNEAAVDDGRYVDCETKLPGCTCFGCANREDIPGIGVQIIERRNRY